MSKMNRKRKLLENDGLDDYSGGIQDEISKFGQHSTSGRQHTIDSDEEVEDDDDYNKRKHNVMDEEEIEGQEAETLEFDGETKITPFNMKDELEEGYFDGNGMYIWNKRDASEIKDSWLDSIDWVKVKPKPDAKGVSKSAEDEDSTKEPTAADVLGLHKKMLEFLKPGETVLRAIKRLGAEGSKQLSASERLKRKKQALKLAAATASAANDKKDEGPENTPTEADQVTRLTELADTILSATGNMDIYQETYESVTFKIRREESKKMSSAVEDDDDMFGDGFTAKKDDQLNEPSLLSSAGETSGAPSINDGSDEVKWEFKWEDKEDAPVYGPHSSSEMHSWVTEGYFKDGVFVRKHKQDGPFYTSKRIDFDIYC